MNYTTAKLVKTDSIIPYSGNAKEHDDRQIKNIAESIKRFGFTQPLVIDQGNVVVIGHGRLLAAKTLGLEFVPCIQRADLTEEEIKQLRIIDNKLNESPWDVELLSAEIETIDFSGFDLDFETGTLKQRKTADLNEPAYQPPVSALRGDTMPWMERKRAWIDFGIRSEKGRV